MIEQSCITNIYNGDGFTSVTIKMQKSEAESLCESMGLYKDSSGANRNESNKIMVFIMGGETEFYSIKASNPVINLAEESDVVETSAQKVGCMFGVTFSDVKWLLVMLAVSEAAFFSLLYLFMP